MQDLHKLSFEKKELEKILRGFYKDCKIVYRKRLARGIMNYVAEVKIDRPSKIFILKISNQKKMYSLEKEIFVIKLLRKHKIPSPKIIKYDYSKKKYPFEILILEKFKSKNLSDVWNKINKENKIKIAYELGYTLARINSIKFKKFCYIIGYNKFRYQKNMYEPMNNDIKNILKKHKKINFLNESVYKRIINVFRMNKPLLLSLNKPVLTHNDFWFDHIFVRKIRNSYRIDGVIDFGFAGIWPKEMDFVKPQRWIFNKGKNIERAFMEGYQKLIKLDKNFKILLILSRILFDLFFIYRLYQTKEIKLAKEYKQNLNKFLRILENEDGT